jgi:AraC-like DNA-binding protein
MHWLIINAAFPLLQGVFLYLFTGFLLQKIHFKAILALHFLPFLMVSAATFVFGEDMLGPLILAVVLSGISYITSTFRMLGTFDALFKRHIHWLKILTLGLAIVWIVFITTGILSHLFDTDFIPHEYIFLSVNVFVFAFGFFGLKEGHLLQELQVKGAYHTSSLSDVDFQRIKVLLDRLAIEEQPFLNPNLKIGDLASQLEVPTHHLSQCFSSYLDTTYYDYVNGLRIAELKRRIVNHQLNTMTLLGLAYDCGFQSKATFNRAFKKHQGQTPSEYLKAK